MSRQHSIFAPSATKRIMACPGSVNLALSLGVQDKAGFFAAEGSVAHALAEGVLSNPNRVPHTPIDASGVEKEYEGHAIRIDEEQSDAIQTYVFFVDELRDATAAEGGFVTLEETVDLTETWKRLVRREPPGPVYGHLDCGAYFPKQRKLVIADYKHGSGVAVEVRDNPQMFVYALGLLFGRLSNADVQTVEIVVIQPRCIHPDGPIRRDTISVVDLMMWAHDEYIPAIEAASTSRPGENLAAGDWCKFCGARADCPELRTKALAVAKQQFSVVTDPDPLTHKPLPPPPDTLTDDQLGMIMSRAEMVETWLDAVRAETAHRLEHGAAIPGWKLVPKRAQRKWTDAAKVETLLTAKLGDEAFKPRELLSPAQAEKALGKQSYKNLVADLVSQVSSGTTLAPETDKRAAVAKGAKAQFTELPDA